MKREQLPLYAIALAVLIVGLAFVGVPLSTLLILPLILACPLMMIFMMRGMDHGGSSHNQDHDQHAPGHEDRHDHHDTSGR
jgi:type III secretory pathway component EscV